MWAPTRRPPTPTPGASASSKTGQFSSLVAPMQGGASGQTKRFHRGTPENRYSAPIITIILHNPICCHQMIVAELGSVLWFWPDSLVLASSGASRCLLSWLTETLCFRALPRLPPRRFGVMSLLLRRWTRLRVLSLEGGLLEVDVRWPHSFSSAPAF